MTRRIINMQEGTFPWVITMGDVIVSTLMHINDLPRPNSTLNRGKILKHNYLHSVEHIIVNLKMNA